MDMTSVVTILRAILTSAPKDGLSPRQILNDYKSIEGHELPFKKFNCNSLEELLQISNEFRLVDTSQGLRVTAKEANATAHMNRFQSLSKKKKKRNELVQRRPIRSPTMQNRWNGSVYSNLCAQAPSRSLRKTVAKQHRTPQSSNNNNNNSCSGGGGSASLFRTVSNNTNNKYCDMRPVLKQQNRLEPIAVVSSSASAASVTESEPLRKPFTAMNNGAPKTAAAKNSAQRSQNRPIYTRPPVAVQSKPNLHERLVQFQSNRSNENANESSNSVSSSIISIKDSTLATGKDSLNARLVKNQCSIDTVDFVRSTQTADEPIAAGLDMAKTAIETLKLDDLDKLKLTEALSIYCRQKGFAQPQYKCLRTRTQKFQCSVTLNLVIHSTYPNDFETEEEAKLDAARIAFQHIKENEMRTQYPVCMDSELNIAIRILECINSNGVFQKEIPKLFQDKFGETLPDNWFTIIADYPQMFSFTSQGLPITIVYPNCSDETNSLQSLKVDIENQSSSSFATAHECQSEPDELVMPWNNKHWNIFVTSVASTVDVWGRLIGKDYSVKMDSILDDIESDLLTNKTIAESLLIGKIYFVARPECLRVRIEQIHKAENRTLCFYIDSGDEEWLPLDQIYKFDVKFVKFVQFPAQAIHFSILGLEDFAENPNAKQHVDEYLAGKSLIAEIKTTEEEYETRNKSSDFEAKISTILYDTSSDEDVRLNDVIMEKIFEKTEPPKLQQSKWNPANISYISDTGGIYCQLLNSKMNLQYVNKQIYCLTQLDFDRNQCRITANFPKELTNSELYLIFDNKDNKWYRASILQKKSIETTSELCKYVDYGIIKSVERENIYRLDLLSAALSKYPHQAIQVRLHDIDSYNPNVIARLRGLLCSSAPVLVRMVDSALIPSVDICKRLENNIFCKINDTIRMEQELEDMTDLLPNADDSFSSSNKGGVESFELELYPMPPLNEYFNAIIVMAPNPSNFIVRPEGEEIQFRKMMQRLKEYCENCKEIVSKDTIKVGNCYAGLNPDKWWYRGIVQTIRSDGYVFIYNCDYGDIIMLSIDALKPLTREFLKLPQLAILARLHGIGPKNSDWNMDDCTRFQELTVDKRFASDVKAIKRHPNNAKYVIELILIDVTTPIDVDINKLLIAEGRATAYKT